MTESIPLQNAEEPVTKTIEFSPIGNGDETTNNTPKGDSQTKRTSFTEKLAATVQIKPREKEEVTTVTEKTKPSVRFRDNNGIKPGEGASHRGNSGLSK